MDNVPDPLLLRESGSAGNRTRDLCICSQKIWPLDQRGGRLSGVQGGIPDSHLYRVTNTRCRIGTVFSPDDGHIVSPNMYRKAINMLRKFVHQFGSVYKGLCKVMLPWEWCPLNTVLITFGLTTCGNCGYQYSSFQWTRMFHFIRWYFVSGFLHMCNEDNLFLIPGFGRTKPIWQLMYTVCRHNFVCWVFLMLLIPMCFSNTEWYKKTGTFENPNKNWRNSRKKIYWQKLNHYNLPFKRQ